MYEQSSAAALGMFGVLDLGRGKTGSEASVTENGRVDITITDKATPLNNTLLTVLAKKSTKETLDSSAASTKERPEANNVHNKPLNINVVIQVVGSRGDVQPFVALGKVLKEEHGHRVRIATHATFQSFVEQYGLEFFNIGGDPAELMAFMVKNPGLMPGNQALKEGQIGERRKMMMEIMQRGWRSCFETGTGTDSDPRQCQAFIADAIIANPPSFAHIHCAERMGIPLHMMFTMPWSPTQAFPHPLSNLKALGVDSGIANFLTYTVVELLTWQGLGDLINSFREITLDLPPLTAISGPAAVSRLGIPHTYCWSPALIPKPGDWGTDIDIAGFFFLDQSISYDPPVELSEFLARGKPPIYVGFGSIVIDDPGALTSKVFQALEISGERALISKGWGGLGTEEEVPSSVLMIDNVPHDWLFRHVSCVVHHGGAGTTSAGIAAGRPTIVVPFFGDQPFWGAMVAKAGAGPDPIPYKELTANNLASAITYALETEVQAKAQEMANSIHAERGSENGAISFNHTVDTQIHRCSLLPDQKAAWKLRNSDVRLSPLAANVLLETGELQMDHLTLYRAREYTLARRSTDPVSGGGAALLGTIAGVMGGISDIPPHIFKRSNKAEAEGDGKDSKAPTNEGGNGKSHGKAKETKSLDLQSSIDAGKGAARIVRAGLRSPMDFTLALAKGFHNAPRLYGDSTVRDEPQVKNLADGIKAAGLGLGHGFWDGISGLFRHPSSGARQDGIEGFAKGMGKAIGGLVFKPAAGVWGVPGYLSEGLWQEVRTRIAMRSDASIVTGRVREGEDALGLSNDETREIIKRKWKLLSNHTKPTNPDTTPPISHLSAAEENIIQENIEAAVEENSRGDRREDDLVARMLQSHLPLRNFHQQSTESDYAESSVIESSSPTISSLTYSDWPEDDPDVHSDEDDNIKEAIRRSEHI